MKKRVIISELLVLCLLLFSCSVEPVETMKTDRSGCIIPSGSVSPSSSKSYDEELLKILSDAVYKASESEFCQRGDVFVIAGIGVKSCGGPAGYIAYKKSNEHCFLKLLNYYNQQAQLYIVKYQIASNCAVEPEPKSVECRDGKPVLVY